MDSTAKHPQNPEAEKVPSLRIGFIGSNAGFLRVKLEDQMGQDRAFSAYDLKDLKEKIKQLREATQDVPLVVITDMILKRDAEELNNLGISLIVINQNRKKDLSFLTPENPQREVRNQVITVESIDPKHVGAILPKLIQAINNLTQPK